MLHLLERTDNQLSLDEAREEYSRLYSIVNDATKIKLKCWLYYCESRNEGGKKAMPFGQYKRMITSADCMSFVRGMIIDCSDIGGYERAKEIIANNMR